MKFFLFLVFFFSIFSLSASPTSVSPNPGYVNQSFTFTVTLSSALPRENDLRIALGDGGGGWLDYKIMEENSNRTYFSYSKTIKKSGDRLYKIGIFSNGALYSETQTYNYTVLPPEADSISKNTATLGEFTNFIVRGRGFSSDFVANIEGTSVHCGKASVSYSQIEFNCRPAEIGRKRFYFKDKAGGDTISGSENWYVEVTQPTENSPPVLQPHSLPNSRYEIGDEVSLILSAHDNDDNLSQIDVDWNDGSSNEVEGRPTTNYEPETFSRVFNTAGQYTISATAYDNRNAASETLRWTITIEESSDINYSPELTIIEEPLEEPQYSYIVGEVVPFTVSAFDRDGNLKQIDVNWKADSGTSDTENRRVANNEVQTFSRTYTSPGIYRVSVTAVDELGATSSTQDWSILIRSEDPPSSYDFKTCSEVQSSTPFDCTKEQSSFDEAEDIFAWVKFEGLSNGLHVVEWLFVNSQLGTEERESSSFTWNEDQWYKAHTRLLNKQPGNWSVEYYLNSEKIGEKNFVIQSEAPTVSSFSPATIVQNQPTEITIEGEQLGSDFVANIEDSESHCHNEGTNNLGTQLKLTCTAEVTGNKRLFLKNRPDGETISGSENWYILVTPEQTPNQPPEFVSGYASPSSVQIGESISFEAIFQDADSENIYNATAHYRIQGEENWSLLVLDAISGNVSTGYTFRKSETFDIAGSYEFRFSAEDNQGESVTTEIIGNFIVESPDPFTLSVVSNNGRTTAPGIDCPGDCSEVLYEPVYLTFTSEPNFGYSFIRWSISGSCESTSDTTNTTIELFIKGDCNAEAIFGLPDSNSAPIITLVEHGKTENKYEGIDFLRSKSGKYLKISDKAVILFKVDDPDEDLDYLDVNFDGSERPPVKVNLDRGSGLYYAEHEYEKSNYPDATTEPFWKRENLEWSAVAYDKNGNASNKLSNSGFGIYDSDGRQKYIKRKLQAEREKLSEVLNQIDRAQKDIEIITSTILKSDTKSEIDLYISESLSNLNLENISYNIDSDEKCLWLDIHNNCLIDQHQSDQKQYSYTIDGEDERYNYLIYVKYSEEAPFPASVWVEYSLNDQGLITPSFQANNSKHLKLLSNLLSEDVKNDIDIYESSSIPPLDHEYKSVCYIGEEDSLSLADVERLENSIPKELVERLKNAVTLSFNTYKDEIVATGNSVANGINIALDSNASIKDRAHGAVSFTYKIPLGTLKAIFSVVDSAIYGAGQPEIDAFLRKTQGITSDAFNSLDEELRNEILSQAGDIADVINSNDELRASFELATLGIGGKYKKATNRQPGVIASRALDVKKKFLKTTSQPLSKIKAVEYDTYLGKKKFDNFGVSVELSGDNKVQAKDIANEGKGKNDPDGKKTEELTNNVFQEILGDTYKSYKELGCYYTNCKHGFDDIFIEGQLDNPTKIVIVESKQLHNGAAKLTKGKGDNHNQMSDEWIDKVIEKLIEEGGEKEKLARSLEDNLTKIDKYVAGVNRSEETLDILMIK
ncbi:hypothetical protein [Pseudoalteromonas sp. Of7M-16]|uniref:PKD domain-containing protein n=1 Tax=Pseudoalteromonas sp. Of7M-16 TaxID=2917756 RepID=UPI001EF54778|nr:hypothetical protein [Pseudoalteromonas sp. Of7M-16]MCG7549046.1 hypothetical protein [Pseudoalteromonas sp. Of7M-16]